MVSERPYYAPPEDASAAITPCAREFAGDSAEIWGDVEALLRPDAEQVVFPSGLLKLQNWPDLADVPDELVEPVVRICALLWHQPRASFLVARLIGGDAARISVILQVLRRAGHVQLIGTQETTAVVLGAGGTSLMPVDAGKLMQEDAVVPPPEAASFVKRLWQKLRG